MPAPWCHPEAGTKGVKIAVPTGLSKPVPVRLNQHPSCQTGLPLHPHRRHRMAQQCKTLGLLCSSRVLLSHQGPKILNKGSPGAPYPSRRHEGGGNNFQCSVMNLQEATWGLN